MIQKNIEIPWYKSSIFYLIFFINIYREKNNEKNSKIINEIKKMLI